MACQTSGSAHFSGSCTEEQYAETAGFTVVEDRSIVESFLTRSGSTHYYVRACLLCHRLIWWQQSPGDCGQSSSISLPISGTIGTYSAAGAGVAGGVAVLTGGSAAAAAGSAVASGALLASGIGAIAAAALLPFAIIGAHHAQALAAERAGLCQVAAAWNEWAATLEAAVKNGTISLDQAQAAADGAQTQLIAALNPLAKTSSDSAALMRFAVKGLVLMYKEKIFPALAPSIEQQIVNKVNSATGLGLSAPNASKGAKIAVIGAGGLLVAVSLMRFAFGR